MDDIKDGTIISINANFAVKLEDAIKEGIITDRDVENFAAVEWIPIDVQFRETRIDRQRTFLTWHYLNDELIDTPHFNIAIFEKLGYEIIQPKQSELPLWDAPDDLLSSKEIVHKYFILGCDEENISRKKSLTILNAIDAVMKDHGIVFYEP